MKTLVYLLLIVIPFLGNVSSKKLCENTAKDMPEEWLTMAEACRNKTRDQVKNELDAAMTYMAMGSHFSKDDVNRPGFAKYFFESASEERGHAMKIISYLLMRANSQDFLNEMLLTAPAPVATTWNNGVDALEGALRLEAKVTNNIRDIIKVCENSANKFETEFNDYHLVDYLSGDFLEEQYQGQRQLAGMISTLKKMTDGQGVLGEYLFDKKLLNNELF